MPASLDELARVDVRYVQLPGWTEDLSTAPRVRGPARERAATPPPSRRRRRAHLAGRRRPEPRRRVRHARRPTSPLATPDIRYIARLRTHLTVF